jgi:hypothetical protein
MSRLDVCQLCDLRSSTWGREKRTTHEVYPRAHAHLLATLHHFERLVEQNLARQ